MILCIFRSSLQATERFTNSTEFPSEIRTPGKMVDIWGNITGSSFKMFRTPCIICCTLPGKSTKHYAFLRFISSTLPLVSSIRYWYKSQLKTLECKSTILVTNAVSFEQDAGDLFSSKAYLTEASQKIAIRASSFPSF